MLYLGVRSKYEEEGKKMKATTQYYEVAELKDGFVYAYCRGFDTIEAAAENISQRSTGNWIINKIEGFYKKNGMFKRLSTTEVNLKSI